MAKKTNTKRKTIALVSELTGHRTYVTRKNTQNTPDNLELMKAGYPPIDIKFTDRMRYYQAFDDYHEQGTIDSMEELFAGYVNARLDDYLAML